MTRIKVLAAVSAILFATTAGALAGPGYSDTYVMKDVRSASGHARSQAAKLADGRACGTSRDNVVSDAKLPAFLDCMNARGWAIARIDRNEGAWTSSGGASSGGSAVDDGSEEANAEAERESAATTAAWTQDQENAAMAQVGADTEAQGIAQMNAALQAAGQP